jgi:hypothetical protein
VRNASTRTEGEQRPSPATRVRPTTHPGQADDAEDPNAIWLVAPDEIAEEDGVGADGGTAVLAVEIANLWLSVSDAWLASYCIHDSMRQRERVAFASDEPSATPIA